MLSIIVAINSLGYIGKDNDLLYHLPSDMKHFREKTKNHTIIMGKPTFESLPSILPHRKHIVLTRDNNYKINDERVEIHNDLNEIILNHATNEEEVFIIGGADIYSKLEPYCNKMYITYVYDDKLGDKEYHPNTIGFSVTNMSGIIKENGLEYQICEFKIL